MFIAACDRRFEIDPAAMQRAGRATAGFGFSFLRMAEPRSAARWRSANAAANNR